VEKAAIAFLDILGFKGIWQSRETEDVLQLLSGIQKNIVETYMQPPPDPNWPKYEPPKITILSDTIVVILESEHPSCLFLIANIIGRLYHYFIQHNLFLRGAVSWGEYSQKDSTFIGPAIDDVASWYEASNWIGTVLTPKTNYVMELFTTMEFPINKIQAIPYIKYHVPAKTGKTNHLYSLNWPAFLQATWQNFPNNEERAQVKELILTAFANQPAFDGSVLEKYENTLQFIDYSIKDLRNRNLLFES